jgi:hypothetical protein
MGTKALAQFKPRLLNPKWPGSAEDKSYTVLEKGSITDLNVIVETFDVRLIKFDFADGMSLRLVRDEDAEVGEKIDTYA